MPGASSTTTGSWQMLDKGNHEMIVYADSITAPAAAAAILARLSVSKAKRIGLVVRNGNASDSTTWAVYGSIEAAPDSTSITAASGWAQIGDNVGVDTSSAESWKWDNDCSWLAITVVGNAASTAADQHFDLRLTY